MGLLIPTYLLVVPNASIPELPEKPETIVAAALNKHRKIVTMVGKRPGVYRARRNDRYFVKAALNLSVGLLCLPPKWIRNVYSVASTRSLIRVHSLRGVCQAATIVNDDSGKSL